MHLDLPSLPLDPAEPSLPCTWLAAVSARAEQCPCSTAVLRAFNKLPLESRAFSARCELGRSTQQRAAGRHALHGDPVLVFLTCRVNLCVSRLSRHVTPKQQCLT